MTRAELDLLERAFESEIEGALTGGLHLIQSKSKVAKKLVADGLLANVSVKMRGRFPVTFSGYELTHAGRIAYCATCKDEPDSTP